MRHNTQTGMEGAPAPSAPVKQSGGKREGFRLYELVLFSFVTLAVAVLCGFLFWKLPSSFVPDEDQGFALTVVQLPSGASIERTKKLMQEAAKKLDFIEAAQYRDEVLKMEELLKEKTE